MTKQIPDYNYNLDKFCQKCLWKKCFYNMNHLCIGQKAFGVAIQNCKFNPLQRIELLAVLLNKDITNGHFPYVTFRLRKVDMSLLIEALNYVKENKR